MTELQFAAVIFPGDKAHDAAAVKIIVEEAGEKLPIFSAISKDTTRILTDF
jgi:hypothetical protein